MQTGVRHSTGTLPTRSRIRIDIAIRCPAAVARTGGVAHVGRPLTHRPSGYSPQGFRAMRDRRHRRDPVRLLDAQLPRAADLRPARAKAAATQRIGTSSIQPGTSSGATRAATSSAPRTTRSATVPPLEPLPDAADVGPHPAEHAKDPGGTGHPHPTDGERRARRDGGKDEEESGR